MRLKQVMENTNLSKKTIYYYIEEGFICPEKNKLNGYFIFTKEDEQKLIQISIFRKIGLTIQDIKDILQYEALSNFIVHRHINETKDKIKKELNHLNNIYSVLDSVPARATPDMLLQAFDNCTFKPLESDIIDVVFPNVDARMIAILTWAPFLEVESNEYRKYLWGKISHQLKLQLDENFEYMGNMIYHLSITQIIESTEYHFFKVKNITNADITQLKTFEDELYNKCVELANEEYLQDYWNLSFDKILKPAFKLHNSTASKLLKEYNPRYEDYIKKMNIICQNTKKRILEDELLLNKLKQKLNKLNLDEDNYAQLIYIYNFKNSIYTKLDLTVLQEIINGTNKIK